MVSVGNFLCKICTTTYHLRDQKVVTAFVDDSLMQRFSFRLGNTPDNDI